MKVVVGIALLCAALGGTPAFADAASVTDADDVADVMDMASAGHRHAQLRGVVVHDLSTFEAWSSEDFTTAEWFFYLRDGDRFAERTVTVSLNPDGSFEAEVRGENGTFLGFANAYRSDDRTLSVELPARLLGARKYRWKAFLHRPCSREPDVECEPVPPDTHRGRVRHVLG